MYEIVPKDYCSDGWKGVVGLSDSLTMKVELSVIENLGFKMYARLPPVVSELVANAWDAEATSVEIEITNDDSEGQQVSVRDNGMGMTFSEVQNYYLAIGRKRREDLGTDKSMGELQRPLMGRKGIGKLSAFGIAKEIELRTVRNGEVTHFIMNIDEILACAENRQEYRPQPLDDNRRRTRERSGTLIILRRLTRKTPIDIRSLRQGLARRFSVLGQDFVVSINGEPITPEERELQGRCEFVWNIPGELLSGDIAGQKIQGWIGTFPEPVSADIGAGIVVMANGKLAQEPTLFGAGRMRAQHALAYMVGEIHADFLDGTEDLISSYRGSIIWASEIGEALEKWGTDAVKKVAVDWADQRRRKRIAVIMEKKEFVDWYDHLSPRDQKSVQKIVDVVTSIREDDPRKTRTIFHYVVEAFEYKSFAELVQEMERLPTEQAGDLLRLFHEWHLIEARELFKIMQGRLAAIKQLRSLIEQDAKEVPDIHNFLVKHHWIIDPSWTVAYDEVYYSRLLKEQFEEKVETEEDRRIDLVCLGTGDTVHIVELKRPSKRIKVKDITQVMEYVSLIKNKMGNHPTKCYRYARGYLVGGDNVADDANTTLNSLVRDVYYYSYADLIRNAEMLHVEFMKVFTKSAIERPVLKIFAEDASLIAHEEMAVEVACSGENQDG